MFQFKFRLFANRNIAHELYGSSKAFEIGEDRYDSCDSCGKNILYGAFLPEGKIQPKRPQIAINEAYVCKECYNKFNTVDSMPFDDQSHIRYLDVKVLVNSKEVLLTESNKFLTIDQILSLVNEVSIRYEGGERGGEGEKDGEDGGEEIEIV